MIIPSPQFGELLLTVYVIVLMMVAIFYYILSIKEDKE